MEQPLVPLWQEFRSYLAVTLEVGDPAAGHDGPQLIATVRNAAPVDDQHPNITFEHVEATVTMGEAAETFAIERLTPGESIERRFNVDFPTIGSCSATATGRVSLEAFSHVRSTTDQATGQLSLAAYVTTFEAIDLQQMLEPLRQTFEVGPSTTLGEIDEKKRELNEHARGIRQRQEQLRAVLGLIQPENQRQRAIRHYNEVTRFVSAVGTALGKMRERIGSPGRVRGEAEGLESQARQLAEDARKLTG